MQFIKVTSILSIIIIVLIYGWNNFWVSEENRSIAPFNSLYIGGLMNVYIKQGDSESLTVRADDNVIGKIKTEVENGKLKIYTVGNISGERVTDAYLTFKKIESIEKSGPSNITTQTPILSESLTIQTNGAGELKIQVNSDSLNLLMNGNSNVQLAGKTHFFHFQITGFGDLMAYNLENENCTASINTGQQSPGIARINVSDSLSASIIGPRYIYYKGNPIIVEKVIEGSGKLESK